MDARLRDCLFKQWCERVDSKYLLAQESDPFRFRLVRPLRLKDIEKIAEVANQAQESSETTVVERNSCED